MRVRCNWVTLLLTVVLAIPAGSAAAKGAPRAPEHRGNPPSSVVHAPPVNDNCDGAILLSCGNINLVGNTFEATNDYTFTDTLNSCTGWRADGKDVVYKLNVGPGDSLWIDYTTIADGSIYLVTDCSNVDGTCVAGADEVSFAGETEHLRYLFTTGGTYYLILDSYAQESYGDWAAVGQLVCGAQTPPPNDLCQAATRLNCGPINLSGSTEFAHNYYQLGAFPCTGHGSEGGDVVYKLQVLAGDSIWVNYTSSTNGSIYIVRDCGDVTLTCVWGEDQNIEGQVEILRYRFEFAGTYYMIMDSRDPGTWGTWTAVGELLCLTPPPVNDFCEYATPIDCGDFSLNGTTQLAYNDYFLTGDSTCTGYETDGKDIVYRFDVAEGDSLWVDYLLAGADGSAYLVTDCVSVDVSCVYGVDSGTLDEYEEVRYKFPAAGTYYLIIDAVDLDSYGGYVINGGLVCAGPVGVEPGPPGAALAIQSAAPNPFSRLTSISYVMPGRSHATLRIYDLQGRVARTLLDGVAEAGSHRITWDGRGDNGARVGPGVYFAQLTSGSEAVVRRMIFVQ